MNASPDAEGFFIAGFAIDGSLEVKDRWNYRDLSSRWSNVCDELLRTKGVNFNHTWSGPLSHIRTRLTSARGAGLCAVYVNDHIAWSSLLLRGNDRGAELATSKMYVNSLQRTDFLQVFAALSEPFAEVLSMSERPVMVFVPIPDEAVSDQDYDVVRELSLHLASAFLRADE